MWTAGKRNFDLWITYYGADHGRYSDSCEYYCERKGGKFPNLYAAYKENQELFLSYDAIMVMDDDIMIDSRRLNRLFSLVEKNGLWLAQPAFEGGKISHEITVRRPGVFMTYTNFVEMNVPIFSRQALERYMAVYDPRLVGWGNDWWFLDVLGADLEGKVAVIDSIKCVNPFDSVKADGKREIDTLQRTEERIRIWQEIKSEHGITSEERGQHEYRRIPMPYWRELAEALGEKYRNLRWKLGQRLKASHLRRNS